MDSGQVAESGYQRSNEHHVPLLLRSAISAIWYEELFDSASDSSYACLLFRVCIYRKAELIVSSLGCQPEFE